MTSIVECGDHNVEITKLKLPGDFAARLKAGHVKELSRSTARFLIHKPLVRYSDWQLISGGDRVAAATLRRCKRIMVRAIECTDTQIAILRAEENVHRRSDSSERLKLQDELIALYTAEEEEARRRVPHDPEVYEHRKSPKTIARERVAKKLGVQPESLNRAERKRRQTLRAVEQLEDPTPCIETLGMDIDAGELMPVARIKGLIEAALASVSGVRRQLGLIRTDQLPFSEGRLQRLIQQTDDLKEALKGAMPASVCPWCKGQPEVQERCTACLGHGYITDNQTIGVPRELKDPEKPAIMVNGQLQPLEVDAPDWMKA